MTKQLLLILLLVVLFLPTTAYAQQESPTPSPVDYTLPYPGLLPDSPWYFLHTIRDSMQDFFVSDPVKKAEFFLLQSDKDISASSMLAQQKDTESLAVTKLDESQRDFAKALLAIQAAKKQGLEVTELTKTLLIANQKHQEVINQIGDTFSGDHADDIQKAERKTQFFDRKVKAFLLIK